jgi:ankyrin repeat protein
MFIRYALIVLIGSGVAYSDITQDMIAQNNTNAIIAEIKKNPQVVNRPIVLETRADVRGDWHHTKTPLYAAVEFNNIKLMRLLIDNGAQVNDGYYNGDVWNYVSESPLYKAIIDNHLELAIVLSERGKANVNIGHEEHSMRLCGDEYCYTTATTTPLDAAQNLQKNSATRDNGKRFEDYLKSLDAKKGGTVNS